MKIRFWPHTQDVNIASFRIRCLLVSKGLSSEGFDSKTISEPEPSDLLILSKRYDERSLEKALRLRATSGTRIALDICDNHFHSKSNNSYTNRRQGDLSEALRSVDLVIASSHYLASELVRHVPDIRKTAIVDDIIESPNDPTWLDRALHPLDEIKLQRLEDALKATSTERQHRLVWFGNAGGGLVDGGMENISLIRDEIESIGKLAPISLTVISNSRCMFSNTCENWNIPTHYLRWSRHTISRALRLHGTSIIPIERNPFTQAKTANRITTSLVHGLAVIADSIPSYQAFSKFVYLDDWTNSLKLMAMDKDTWMSRVQLGIESIQVDQYNRTIIGQWKEAIKGF